jgi:hypothetical protein
MEEKKEKGIVLSGFFKNICNGNDFVSEFVLKHDD